MRLTNLHDVHTAGSRRVLGGFSESSCRFSSIRDLGDSWKVCSNLLAASRLLWLWCSFLDFGRASPFNLGRNGSHRMPKALQKDAKRFRYDRVCTLDVFKMTVLH